MKQKITKIAGIFAMSLVAATACHASGADGSGGGIGVIVEGRTYLLDIVEARPITLKTLPEYKTFGRILDVLQTYNGELSRTIRSSVENSELYFYFSDFQLIPTKDANSLVSFDEVQLAAQRGNAVFINSATWAAADETTRVATLYHEILLHGNRGLDRMNLRLVVNRIMSENFVSDSVFTKFLWDMGMTYHAEGTSNCKTAAATAGDRALQYHDMLEQWLKQERPSRLGNGCVNREKKYKDDIRFDAMFNIPAYCYPSFLAQGWRDHADMLMLLACQSYNRL